MFDDDRWVSIASPEDEIVQRAIALVLVEVRYMGSPERPDTLDPTIDQSLLELDGTTYRDVSPSAAAKRAAYHQAMSLKSHASLSTSSSSATTREQTLSAPVSNARFKRFDNFENDGTAPDYTAENGSQGPGPEGWTMHSTGSESTRLRFNVPFNDGSAPYTLIRASFRGAPDNGKNSYVCLREQRCADDPGHQSGCDEVDIVEYYGYPRNPRSEWTFYQNGNSSGNVGHGGYFAPTNPGRDVYNYEVYLEKGTYIKFAFASRGGPVLGEWARHSSEGYVPTQPMYLYAGIWDCSSSDSTNSWCNDGSGPFRGDSWCALHELYMDTGG